MSVRRRTIAVSRSDAAAPRPVPELSFVLPSCPLFCPPFYETAHIGEGYRGESMSRVCSWRATVWFAPMALFCASLAFGQSDLGTISGYVRDQSGASVPNAKVTARNT